LGYISLIPGIDKLGWPGAHTSTGAYEMAGEAESTSRAGGGGANGGDRGDAAALPEPERLLTPAEVASMFRVDPKTVTRWARDGRLTAVRTLGGHRRYLESEVLALLRAARSADAG
jgi:excisionase family DNA binding protein